MKTGPNQPYYSKQLFGASGGSVSCSRTFQLSWSMEELEVEWSSGNWRVTGSIPSSSIDHEC